ncbi:MAG TPA: tRNA lysidine(34) synthetase TilS [Candidatus Krumholzibacteria bacterium]|nr:tRNA lysidine(34) synthetase TilS [Candidatus Krumholzibacteria bacterium]
MSTAHDHNERQRSLLEHVRRNLAEKCRFDGRRLLLAVSGGADSVALLRLLVDAPERRLALAVAHFDHRLRPESGADAHFVRELSARFGCEFTSGNWDEPEAGEAAARAARHTFLQRAAQELACDAIALAHQQDDQLETVLMRFGRGCGPRGLLGMRWRRGATVDLVRPLLDCPRAELVGYLREIGQTWREDPANEDSTKTRNRVRHRVLPALDTAFGRAWRDSWSASIEDQRALWTWAETNARDLLVTAKRRRVGANAEALDLEPLRAADEALRRAALQQWLDPLGQIDLRRAHVARASDLIRHGHNGDKIVLARDLQLTIEGQHVLLVVPQAVSSRAATARTAAQPWSLEIQSIDPRSALAEIADFSPGSRSNSHEDFPPEAEIVLFAPGPEFHLRAPLPGESLRLLGAPGSRRIRRILQDKHVPPRLRASWPVVADSEGIVWIPGIGIAERCRLEGTSPRAFRLILRSLQQGTGSMAAATVGSPERL